MHLIHQLILALISATQPPKMNLHEFMRDINPPRIGQHLEIRLKDNAEETIFGTLRGRTRNNYVLETNDDLTHRILILNIDTITYGN